LEPHAHHRRTGGETDFESPQRSGRAPHAGLVKQAVFNSLGPRVVGRAVLELFGGSGALSLECLSRGAASAVCVEKSPRHAEFIRRNAQAAGLSAGALEVRVQDVFAAVPQLVASAFAVRFDSCRPPTEKKTWAAAPLHSPSQLLDDTNLPKLLAPDGLFVLGHTKRDTRWKFRRRGAR